MSVRAVVFFNFGPPFGGFRLAASPEDAGLDFPEGFNALERAVERAYTLLSHYPPGSWPQLARREDPMLVARLGHREIVLDVIWDPSDDPPATVLVRAWLPFRAWPFGGWVVYEGRRRAPDGTWTPLSPEEVSRFW